jgi:ADP-heptose:LPS heptosyltransferase
VSRHRLALAGVGRLTALQARVAQAIIRPRARAALPFRRILVVRLDETIGDSVMFSPFLRELRAAAPEASIALVANTARRDMFVDCPYIDEVITTDMGSAASASILARPFGQLRFAHAHLDGAPFDLAFVPRVDYDHHAAFIAHASRAPVRVGFSAGSTERKQVVNRGIERLLTDVRVATPHTHEIDRQLSLLDVVGSRVPSTRTEVWIGADDAAAADSLISEHGLDDFVVVAPTGGHSDLKQWPIERYSAVAQRLLDRGQQVVVIGAPADAALFDQLSPSVQQQATNLIGALSVMRSAAVLARASGFVGADSGMTHVAGALGIPTVGVFGPTCVHTFAPSGDRAVVVSAGLSCGPCARGVNIDRCATCIFDAPLCMAAVTADRAVAALDAANRSPADR